MKVLINKTSVEEGINEELINILQTCTSLDPQNLIKVKKSAVFENWPLNPSDGAGEPTR